MDNENTTPISEAETKVVDDANTETVQTQSQPAFDYQPPVVNAPEPPTVSDMPEVQPQVIEQPQYHAPQPQTQQYQVPTYQAPQPQSQQYQVPTYQAPQPQTQQYQVPTYQAPQPQTQQYQVPTYQAPQPQYQAQPAYTQQQYYQYAPVNPAVVSQQNTSDGFAVASLICSIVGILACCTFLPSLLAVIFGAISKAKNDGTRPTVMSTVGLVLGIIGLIVNLFVVMIMVFSD